MGSRSKEFDDSSSRRRAATPKPIRVNPTGGSIFDQLQQQMPTSAIPVVAPGQPVAPAETPVVGSSIDGGSSAPARPGRRVAGYAPGYPTSPAAPEYPVAPTNVSAPSPELPENPYGPRVVRVAPEDPIYVENLENEPFADPGVLPLTSQLIPDTARTGVVESITQQRYQAVGEADWNPEYQQNSEIYQPAAPGFEPVPLSAHAAAPVEVDEVAQFDSVQEPLRKPKQRTEVKYRNAVVGPAVPKAKKSGRKRSGIRRSSSESVRFTKKNSSTSSPTVTRTGRTVTLVAMAFIAALAVSTSVPANALLTDKQVQALSSGTYYSEYEPVQEIQAANSTIASGRDQVSGTAWGGYSGGGLYSSETYVNNPMGTIQWPLRRTVPISDLFGIRSNPFGAGTSFHHGMDFNPGIGAPIQAIADGVVSFREDADGGGLGYYVIIDHNIDGMKFQSVYGHMLAGSVQMQVGQEVHVTDIVGQVGNTGASTGPHLHFEIRIDGAVVDPLAWLRLHAN